MELYALIAIICCILLIVINVVAMTLAWRSIAFSQNQLAAQTLVVWILPGIGALVVGLFAYTQRYNTRMEIGSSARVNQDAISSELFKDVHPSQERQS